MTDDVRAGSGATLDGAPATDFVQPFRTLKSHAQGRLVRLSGTADRILHSHNYPDPVCAALGEALGLTAMLGALLDQAGKLIVQTKTDGPVPMLVVNYEAPGRIRGYASFDAERLAAVEASGAPDGALHGMGHLALTIDKGEDAVRYQGIVALENATLTEAAHNYFKQSEQIPSFIRLAVAKLYGPRNPGNAQRSGRAWQWCVGGLILQHLPADVAGLPDRPGDVDDDVDPEDNEDWRRVKMLAATVEDHELLDPTLEPEHLLYRLFAEEEVMAFPREPVEFYCRCSRERVAGLLKSFDKSELEDMKEPDGSWSVTCEFCNATHRFTPADL